MTPTHAPGLPARWVNAWLAALGVTVLLPDARLGWQGRTNPSAVFLHDDFVGALAAALPDEADLHELAIARSHPQLGLEFPRKVATEQWIARVSLARAGDSTLTATVTDLVRERDEPIAHSPFDSAVPKGLTLHDRLIRCRQEITDPVSQIAATLAGCAERKAFNGLGFDYTRLLAPTDPLGGNWCDPVVEFLAFYGLAFMPVRGDGTTLRVRGWVGRSLKRGSFSWPTWDALLDAANIDALLDQFWNGGNPAVSAAFGSVPYQPRGSADSTRAFASERIR
jgi:hypothetical protein